MTAREVSPIHSIKYVYREKHMNITSTTPTRKKLFKPYYIHVAFIFNVAAKDGKNHNGNTNFTGKDLKNRCQYHVYLKENYKVQRLL